MRLWLGITGPLMLDDRGSDPEPLSRPMLYLCMNAENHAMQMNHEPEPECPNGDHYHCFLPDCWEAFAQGEEDELDAHLRSHPIEEWMSNYGWMSRVNTMVLDLLRVDHPDVFEHVVAEIESLRAYMTLMHGPGMN